MGTKISRRIAAAGLALGILLITGASPASALVITGENVVVIDSGDQGEMFDISFFASSEDIFIYIGTTLYFVTTWHLRLMTSWRCPKRTIGLDGWPRRLQSASKANDHHGCP